MKVHLTLLLLGFTAFVFAQNPANSSRLPVTADMPEWAKPLYRDNVDVNVFALDAAFAPWAIVFDSLKVEMAKAGNFPDPDLKHQFEHYKLYYKYYTRWRARINPYLQADGTLDFSILTDKDFEAPPQLAAKSSSSNWSFLGPVVTRWRQNDNAAQPHAPWQANVYSIDVAPSDANIVYCGTETGVVNKSTDKGLTWSPVGTNTFTNNIGAIAIHPSNPDIVYVSELPAKIQTSTDGGATWSTALNIGGFNAEDIKIKPDDPEVVLASGSSLQRRTVGNVWTNVLNKKSYDIAFKPDDPSIAYVLVENVGLDLCEFWKSTDGGQTWSIRSSGWITGLTDGGGRLTVTPADNDRIYAVLLTGSGPRVMRSDDAGENWTTIASSNETGLIGPCTPGALSMTNGQGFFDLSIAASHTNADHIILGTTTSFKSTDGGVTYTLLGGYCGPFNIHPDIQEMHAMGTDTWIVTDGGVNLSTDFYTDPTIDVNYFVRINNLRGSEQWGFDIGWNEDVLMGGRYHDGNTAWRETYPAGDFLRMGGGEAATGYVNPGNPSLLYYSDIGGKVLPTNNTQPIGSFTVTKWPNEHYLPLEGGEQKWDPRYMYTYYLGNGNQFWKTTDNGLSFTSLFTHTSATAEIRYIEVSRSNPNVIYFTVNVTSPANDGELWKTSDGGATWTKCNNPGTLTANQRRLSKITMSGTDENTIWWCFRTGPNGQKVFKSIDGGSTWVNWTTAALDNLSATDIVHQFGTDGGVYFITGSGGKVLYRDNPGTDWTAYNTDLPLNLYGDFGGVLAKPFYKGGKLRLGTGNGIWEADLYTTSTTTLVQPMVDKSTTGCERDTLQLESYSVVNGPATYQWSLSPSPQWISDANIRNPRVVLGSTAGFYAATLTVTDNNGTTTRTINNFINNLDGGNLCAADTIPGKTLSLDGSGDYAVPNANLNLNSNTVSMTAWVKRNGTQVDFAGIVYARGGTTSAGLSITSGNGLRYTWNDAAGSYGFNTGFTIPDNAWTHIALVITSANAKVYMNGVAATRTASHPAEAFDTPVKIGLDNGSRYFKGQIDEVTVWNKSLTQNEIRDLMHLTLIPADQPDLVSYYQFNEPSGDAMDKVGTRHAALVGNATRVVSTGPFGGGKSSRQSVTTGGLKTFASADVLIGFPVAGTYPNGEIVVNRINLQPDSLPPCSSYHSDNHYWIIDNYGTNQTFTALDSLRLGNFLVPTTDAISPLSYKLKKRTVNAHLLPWTEASGNSIGATGGTNGRITFGTASVITQFGQFLATNPLDGQIITGISPLCSGDDATLDAGAGYSSYAWSDGGGSSQMATYPDLMSTSTFTVTVTDANGCTGSAMKTIIVNPLPTLTGPNSVDVGATINLLGSGTPAAMDPYLSSNTAVATVTNAGVVTGVSISIVTITYTDINGCTATHEVEVTAACPNFPGAPSNVTIVNSTCGPVCTVSGGSITAPSGMPCPSGSTIQYQVNGGSWSTTVPVYNQTGPVQSIKTHCNCDADNSMNSGESSAIATIPGACNFNAPLSTTQINVLCNGNSSGSIDLTVSGGVLPYTYSWTGGATTEDRSGLSAGTYSVTVTDANGCTLTTSATITEPSAIGLTETHVNATCGNSNGSIDLSVIGGTGAYTYSWTGGATTQDRSGLAAGTYTVTVTDANTCTKTLSVTITEPAAILLTETHVNVLCSGGSTGSIDLTVAGGVSPYTYSWTGGATTQDRSGLTAGTYTVTVTDANTCTKTLSTTITEAAAIVLTETHVNVLCNGGSTGSIDLTVSGGVSPYTYSWTGGATTQDRSGLTAGTYTVTVTDVNSCTKTLSVTITEAAAIVLTETHLNVLCNGGSTGSIDLTVAGGVSPYTYSWTGGATTQDRSGLTAGTYTVTVTDVNTCTKTLSTTITEAAALTLTETHVNVLCNGGSTGSIDLTVAGGVSPYTYSWTGGATTQDRSSLTAGTYTVTVTDANTCTKTLSVTITEAAAIVLTETHVNVLCNGGSTGSIDLTVAGGVSPYTYSWTGGATTQDRSGLAAGTYTVTVTDANTCTKTLSVTITEAAAIVLTETHVNVLCNGGNTGSIDLTVAGGISPYTYSWTGGATTQDRSGLTAGTYTVTVTDANTCTKTLSVTIMGPAAILLTETHVNVLCNGSSTGSIDLTVSGGVSPYTYSWTGGATTQDRTSLTAGTYTVTVTDVNACTKTLSTTITQPTALTLSSTIVNPSNCFVADGSIDLSPSGGTPAYTYDWSNDGPDTPDNDSQDLLNLLEGTYTVTVTDANGCTATHAKTLDYIDIVPPMIVCPANQNLPANASCSGTVGLWNPISVSDNCTALANIIITQSPSSNTVLNGHNDSELVTLTANDGNGNISSCSFSVTLKDVTPPVAKCQSVTANLGSNGMVILNPNLVNNGSTDNCGFSLQVIPGTFNCSNLGMNSVILRATDFGGNISTCSAKVNIKDASGPNALCKNPTIFLNSLGQATLSVAQVNNGSTDNCGINTMSISKSTFNCSEIGGTQPVTLSIIDINGNSSSCLSNVTVKDAIAPTAICTDVTVQLGTNGYAVVYSEDQAFQSTDNCSVWSYSPIAKVYTMANLGDNNLTITVKDWSGNASTCVSVVTVEPHNSPSPFQPDNGSALENNYLPFIIYPNPTRGDIFAAFELPEDQSISIRVFDMQGRMVLDQEYYGTQGENTQQIHLSDVASGIYLLDFSSNDLNVQRRLIILRQ